MNLFDYLKNENFFKPFNLKCKKIYYDCMQLLIDKTKELPVLYESDARDCITFYLRNTLQIPSEDMSADSASGVRDFLQNRCGIAPRNRIKEEVFQLGDIDAGGFLIHQNLCQATGKQFDLHCMGISELENEKFAIARKTLTSNDVRRLHTLLEKEEYRHTIEYMLANNCKMEQEIVSLFFCRRYQYV